MQSRSCRPGRAISFFSVFVFLLLFCGLAQGQELEGTWRLVMSKLPDGTTQTPPAVLGAGTLYKGHRQVAVVWHTPEGKPASFFFTSNVKLSDTEWTETVMFSALDDGSGKAPVYNLKEETWTVPVTREGTRVAFKDQTGSSVIEGDKWAFTSSAGAVNYWERVR
jgi:hypothetical protein